MLQVSCSAFPLISLQRFKVELSFVTERVVEALSSDVHGSEQVLGRSRGVAFRPESAHRAVQCFVSIELSRPNHGLTILVMDRSVNIDAVGYAISARSQCCKRSTARLRIPFAELAVWT